MRSIPGESRTMPKISACIISFNEDRRIEDCLKSLAGVADQIVVVDSESTDRTREIAALHAHRVINQAFLGYIEQKNFALDQAANDWVLSLDCDERLTPELSKSILDVKDRLAERSAWSFNRKNFFLYRWLEHARYPDRRVRLFDRRICRWGGTNPHDHIEVSSGTTGWLRGDLLHYSFDSLSAYVVKMNKYSDIAAAELIRKGRKVPPAAAVAHGVVGFVRIYIFKRGFLDGFAGLADAVSQGFYAFCKYGKAYLAQIAPKG
jgi:glycosyltransferase involved in cell wall biosynthesis